MTIWHLDPDSIEGDAEGSDPAVPRTFLLMESPDGTVWSMTVDNTGGWVAAGVLATEAGDGLLTEAGDPLLLEA